MQFGVGLLDQIHPYLSGLSSMPIDELSVLHAEAIIDDHVPPTEVLVEPHDVDPVLLEELEAGWVDSNLHAPHFLITQVCS